MIKKKLEHIQKLNFKNSIYTENLPLMHLQKIQIKNLSVYAKIGCYNWEKVITQKLLITTIISIDINNLQSFVDYYEISQDIKSFTASCRCNFLEEMAKKLLDHIMINNKILKCHLQILKPSALDGLGGVSVIVESI